MIHWFTANVQILKIDPCKKVMILSPGIQPIYKDTLGRSKFRSNEKEPDASQKKILELYFSQLVRLWTINFGPKPITYYQPY